MFILLHHYLTIIWIRRAFSVISDPNVAWQAASSDDLTDASSSDRIACAGKIRSSRFHALLLDAVRSGAPVTEELVAALDSDATQAAVGIALDRPHQEFAYLPIFPGLEQRDDREAASCVLKQADDVHDYAYELHERGIASSASRTHSPLIARPGRASKLAHPTVA
jgi:hypothetical protein